jgi:hypothetical protein
MSNARFGNGSPKTLCWDCIHAVPDPQSGVGCEWSESKATVPVPGWDAMPQFLRNYMGPTAAAVPTYCVLECPKFRKG